MECGPAHGDGDKRWREEKGGWKHDRKEEGGEKKTNSLTLFITF